MNIALFVIDDVQKSTTDLKREFKSAKLPHIRFYPNEKTGDEKRDASFEIVLPRTGDIDAVRETIIDEIHSNFVSDVKDVSEKVYYSMAGQNARDGIVTVLYYYDDEDGVDFKFRAVSADPYLQEGFAFMALDGPSASLVGEGSVPGVQGMLIIDEENPSPRVFNFAGLSTIQYREVVNTLL